MAKREKKFYRVFYHPRKPTAAMKKYHTTGQDYKVVYAITAIAAKKIIKKALGVKYVIEYAELVK